MAQKIYVDFEFRANTEAAKKQVQDLQITLNNALKASTTGAKSLDLTPKLEQARLSAMQLKSALESATNVDTGRLNLHKFTNNLRTAGLDVKTLGVQLQRLGPEGTKAFQQMAGAMATADAKVISLEGGMRRLVNTFANTLRYQASAYAIQAVTKSITSAISYTKELDKALTDIWMVTDLSADTMKTFAQQANVAAKALSTTTTQYAKAAQIYFQQGLDIGEAMKRAETTIRLAHATGDSMEEVSNWMTAIWNNFDNGTKTLEYYADVLAKLGAETASSADEIATGLEKFAAVAETVGLSYEYAASALATITAETRQSADVVGTALKTLFARIEGLKLGDTLEDGTDLNKYSAALKTIGVDIKDANDELKNMDLILDETAAKWNTLSKDEQVALAQSVAGIRQYTQFIALMDNYDVMKNNIDMSRRAAGSLADMQTKYEQSVEGMSEKLKAESESLIRELFDEDLVKGFLKTTTHLISFVTKLTDAFGGLPGILMMAATALTKMYQPQIATMFTTMAQRAVDTWTHIRNVPTKMANAFRSDENQKPLKQTFAEQQREQANEISRQFSAQQSGGIVDSNISQKIYEIRQRMLQNEGKLTAAQKDQLQWQITILENSREELRVREQELEKLQQISQEKQDAAREKLEPVKTYVDNDKVLSRALTGLGAAVPTVDSVGNEEKRKQEAETLIEALNRVKQAAMECNVDISNLGFEDALQDAQQFADGANIKVEELQQKILALQQSVPNAMQTASDKIKSNAVDFVGATANNVGRVEGNMQEVVDNAKQFSGRDLNTSQTQEFKTSLSDSLNLVRQQADALGMDIKEIGFEALQQEVEAFSSGAQEDVDALIKKVEQLQNRLTNAGSAEIQSAKDKAALGMVDKDMGHLNAIQMHSNQPDTDPITAAQNMVNSSNSLSDTADNQSVKDESKKLGELLKARQALKKEYEDSLKAEGKGKRSKKELAAMEAKYRKNLQDNTKAINDQSKKVRQAAQVAGNKRKVDKASAKDINGLKEANQALGAEMDEAANSARNAGAAEAGLAADMQKVNSAADQMTQKIMQTQSGFEKFGQGAATVASTLMSVLNGVNMLYNGFKSLRKVTQDGTADFEDYLSVAMSIGPALMMLVPSFVKVVGWMGKKIAMSAKDRAETLKNAATEEAASGRKVAASISSGLAKVAEWMATGPWGWVIAGIGAAALAAIGATVLINTANAKADQEMSAEEAAKQQQIGAAANDIGRSLNGISEQVDTFKNLRESGQSTLSVIEELGTSVEDLRTQMDNLYKEGARQSDWGVLESEISSLAAAYEQLKSGAMSIEAFEKTATQAQQAFAVAQAQHASTVHAQAVKANAGNEEKIKEADNAYVEAINTAVQSSDDVMQRAENNFLKKTKDFTSSKAAEDAWIESVFDALGVEEQAVNDDMRSTLLGSAPSKVLQIINGLKQFEQHGAVHRSAGGDQDKIERARAWVGGDANKMAYANLINFGEGDESTWTDRYNEIYDDMESAAITQRAEKLGYDEDSFNIYTDSLVETNDQLIKNDQTAKRVAYNNLKLDQGLKKLTDSWGDIATGIKQAEKGSIEYATALAKMQDIMEEAFGVKFDADFLEDNFHLVEKAINGDIEALQQLQKEMAKDYVLQLDYVEAKTGASKTPQEIRDTLWGLLNELEKDLPEFTIGQDINTEGLENYKIKLNELLTNGQYDAEKLQEMLALAGFGADIGADGLVTSIYKTARYEEIQQQLKKNLEDKRKKIEQETNAYYKQEQALSRLEKAYSKLERAKSRAYGQDYLDYLEEEMGLIASQSYNLQEQVEVAEKETNKYRDELKDLGAKFDPETGEMLNYAAMMQYFYDNAGSTADDYEKFKDALSNYEKSMEKADELNGQIADNTNTLLDLRLEAIDYRVNLDIQLSDRDIAYLEYQIENLVNPATKAADAIELIGTKMAESGEKVESTRRGIELIFDAANENLSYEIGEIEEMMAQGNLSFLDGINLTKQDIEKLQEYSDTLMEENRALKANIQEVFSTITDEIEAWSEQFDRIGGKIEHQTSILDTYKNVMDLIGRKKLGISTEYMNKMVQQQVKNAQLLLKTNKENYDTQKQNLESLKAQKEDALSRATSEEDIARINADWDEAIQNAEDKVQELEQAVNDSWVGALEAATQAFETGIQLAIEDFESAMTGVYGTFEQLAQVLSQMSQESERYVPDYTKIYELSKLNRDISKSIDTTSSLKGTQELAKLQAEINKLQKSDAKLSKYELDNLRKKYELRLAEIALEEAQQTKSQVRMRRDSEGNWSYVYTANENSIAGAQQNLENAMHSYSTFTQDEILRLQEAILTVPQNIAEEIEALGPNATQEERARITQFWSDQAAYWTEQLNIALRNAANYYKDDWTAYGELIDYKVSKDKDWVDRWEETQVAQISGFKTLEEWYHNFTLSLEDFNRDIEREYDTYQGVVEEVFGEVKISIEEVANVVAHLEKQLLGGDGEKSLADKASEAFTKMAQSVGAAYKTYERMTQDYIERNNQILRGLGFIFSSYDELEDMNEGFYGVITIGNMHYRSEEKFTGDDAEQKAKNWAESERDKYNAGRDAYIAAGGNPQDYVAATVKGTGASKPLESVMFGTRWEQVPEYKDTTAPSTPGGGGSKDGYFGVFTHPTSGIKYRTENLLPTEEDAKNAATELGTNILNSERVNAGLNYTRGTGTWEDFYSIYSVEQNWDKNPTGISTAPAEAEQYITPGINETTAHTMMTGPGGKRIYFNDTIKPNKFELTSAGTLKMTVAPDGKVYEYKEGEFDKAEEVMNAYSDAAGASQILEAATKQLFYVYENSDYAWWRGRLMATGQPYHVDGLFGLGAQPDEPLSRGWYIWEPHQGYSQTHGFIRYYDNNETAYVNSGETLPTADQNKDIDWPKGVKADVFQRSDLRAAIGKSQAREYKYFDTGGYTGSWDSSGRLAILHQKEIVLNAHDTENFLAAVNIVRDIASMIDLKAAAQTAALSAFTKLYPSATPQTIEQSVTIHAEFPNATNHFEIEEAFDSLINRAAQFANQKK